MSYKTQRPHIASYVILRRNNKIAFVLRSNTDWMRGFYGLPAGKVEENESFVEAAVREAKEEVGVDVRTEDLEPAIVIHRHQEGDHAPDWVDVYFEVLKWEGEPYNAEPHMHSELAWLDPKKLPKNVIPSIKHAITQIESGKSYTEYGWSEMTS